MFNKSETNYEKKISDTLAGLFNAVSLKSAKTDSRLQTLETKSGVYFEPSESLGLKVQKGAADFRKGRGDQARINVSDYEIKAAIIGAGTQNDPLGNAFKPMLPANRNRLFIRDLMSPAPTKEAAIEYPKVSASTNNAAAQNRENTSLAESAYTFDLTFEPVQTIGHFIPVSKNILDDSSILNAFLGARLLYDLRVEEERQILNGVAANSELNGLLISGNYTAFSRIFSPDADNAKQRARRAMTQLELADFTCTGLVLHPSDWEAISLLLSIEPSTNALYGVPVASTANIASGTFLAGDFSRGCSLFDREDANISISKYNDNNFTTGLITLKAESRVSLVVADALGLVSGSF